MSKPKRAGLTVEEALSKFMVQLEANGRSEHTQAQYQRHVGMLAGWLGPGARVDRLDHEDVARFLASPEARSRRGGGLKRASSMNALRSSLKTFFAFLRGAGYTDRDVGRLIQRAKCRPGPPRGLTAEEQKRLLETLRREDGGRDYMLFHLLLATGIRIGSALALRVEDVDLVEAEVRLPHAKGGRVQDRIFLGPAILEHLESYLADRREGPLFVSIHGYQGNPMDGGNPMGPPITARHANRRLGFWLERAGIARKVPVHGLRHSFALGLYERTGDIALVKEALRHRSIASTLVYASVDERRLRTALP